MHSQYNILPYNTMQYSTTDAIDLTFNDAVIAADVRTNLATLPKVDSVNASDGLSKQIVDKRLNDTLRENDWFTVKGAPQSDPWS